MIGRILLALAIFFATGLGVFMVTGSEALGWVVAIPAAILSLLFLK